MKTIDELLAEGVKGKRVFVRADLNVPLAEGTITDDGRIRAVLPTIAKLAESGARVVVASHLGRPKGAPDPAFSLAPAAARLGELLGAEVAFATDTVGSSAKETVGALTDGRVAVIENLRFNAGETSKDDAERGAFAEQLAELADLYVGDGFGAVHRKHASVFDLPARLPHAVGYLIATEVGVLKKLTDEVRRPYVVVLGGAKVSDKLAVIDELLGKADRLLIGGGMAYTFLYAKGYEVGISLLQKDQVDVVKEYMARAEANGVELVLPVDILASAEFPDLKTKAPADFTVVDADGIPADKEGLDIGPKTRELYASKIADAETVFWNGPLASSSTPTTPEAPARSRRPSSTATPSPSWAAATAPPRSAPWLRRERFRPHFHRRRRLPRIPRGQDAPRPRRPGG